MKIGKLTTEIALQRCKEKLGDKYEYIDLIRNGKNYTMKAKCKKHGGFIVGYYNLLKGANCPKCVIENQKTIIYGYGINDYDGLIKINGEHLKSYHLWTAMLERVYDKTQKRTCVIYEGCSVCEEWKYFSNFKKWFDENYIEGYALDKDILHRGNKIYSPENCVYVPKFINSILLFRGRDRGEYPVGIYINKRGKFIAEISLYGKVKTLGTYKTQIEAFNTYKQAKEKYIKEVAQKYYDEGKIDERVYNALINWKININD